MNFGIYPLNLSIINPMKLLFYRLGNAKCKIFEETTDFLYWFVENLTFIVGHTVHSFLQGKH